ncbi:hypothetical protein AALM74_16565 [Parabacteroides segnis]|uniref:hypothetical protein n=1 Tax=Parabacteroides segnis TaxID=2763058 RepID=UPI0035114D1E
MKIIIKFSKTLVIGFVFIVIIVLLVLWFMDIYRSQKEKLHSEAFIFFTEAMQKEKKQRITVRKKYYDSQKSLNDFSEEEKNAWFNQDYLADKDSNRYVLDSLFHQILLEHNIQAETAIRCIRNGKSFDSSTDSTLYEEAKFLGPIVCKKDKDAEKDITLLAYVNIPARTVLNRMGWFLTIPFGLLILVGLVWVYLRRQAESFNRQQAELIKQKEAELLELKEAESLKLQQAESVNRQQADLIKRKETELLELKEAESLKLHQAESVNRHQAELIERKEAELLELKEAESLKLHQAESVNRQLADLIKRKEAELLELKETESLKLQQAESVNRQLADLIERKETELLELKEAGSLKLQQAESVNRQQAELIEQKEAEILKLQNKRTFFMLKKNPWIALPCDFYFHKQQRILRFQEKLSISLKGNSSKLFKCFIEAENYKLTHKDICVHVLGRLVESKVCKSDQDCVAMAISRLRENLRAFPCIKIESDWGTGYQMTFSNYQNDTTQPGKSD